MKSRIVLTILSILFFCQTYADDIKVENADGVIIFYDYYNNGTELIVVKTAGNQTIVNIPEKVTYMGKTRKVTGIGSYAFYDHEYLTSVTIPNSVTFISNNAFNYCI